MSIFQLHKSVLDDYRNFVRSFFTIADERAREFVNRALMEQAELWPEPLLQLNPSYARAASVDENSLSQLAFHRRRPNRRSSGGVHNTFTVDKDG